MATIRALTVTAHGAGDVLAVTEQELPAPAADLERLGQAMAKNAYGQYLLAVLREPPAR